MKLSAKKGFTIIEGIVALALISTVVVVFFEGIKQFRLVAFRANVLSSNEKQINDIAENIRANFQNYQVNFDYTSTKLNQLLTINNLPMAWDLGVNLPVSQCTTCRGKYGFVIQPLDSFRGLYTVTLRFTYQDWGAGVYKDYVFLVSAK